MATNTNVRIFAGSTGASGAAGFTGLLAAHATAITTAVTAATQVAGVLPPTIQIGQTQLIQDSNAGILEMYTAINYITQA